MIVLKRRSALMRPTVVSSTYTVTEDDEFLACNMTSRGETIGISTSLADVEGWNIIIKDENNTSNRFPPNIVCTGRTIDGALAYQLNGEGDIIQLYSDGTNLFILK